MKNFFLIAVLLLAACGFEPVYGVNRNMPVGVETHMEQIEIANIPDREGQYLRNALIDRFYRDGRPMNAAYILEIERPQERLTKLDITKTDTSTRGQLRLQAKMILRGKGSKEPLLIREVRTITSYNILGSEFATRITEEDARKNALDDLARQIELQLSLYFRRK